MTTSLIETIYLEIADESIGDNPLFSAEVRDKTQCFLGNYSTKENLIDMESEMSHVCELAKKNAFIAGFKTAMKFMQEVAL